MVRCAQIFSLFRSLRHTLGCVSLSACETEVTQNYKSLLIYFKHLEVKNFNSENFYKSESHVRKILFIKASIKPCIKKF